MRADLRLVPPSASPACAETDPELFFPVRQEGETTSDWEYRQSVPKTICNGCFHQAACLEYAFAAGERYGVWGGVDLEEERRQYASDRRRAQQAS